MTTFLFGLLLACDGLTLQDPPSPPEDKEEVGPFVRLYRAGLDGRFHSEQGATRGTRLSLEDDLGFDAPSGAWEIGIRRDTWHSIANAHSRLQIGFLYLDARERHTLDGAETYNSRTFAAGERLETRFQANALLATMEFGFAGGIFDPDVEETEPRRFEFGLLVGGGTEWAKLSVESKSTGVDTDEQIGHAVVGFGAFAWVEPLPILRIGGRTATYIDALGIFAFYSDTLMADSSLVAQVNPTKYLSIEVGYRFVWSRFNLDRDDELYGRDRDFRFQYSMSALFAGVNVKF